MHLWRQSERKLYHILCNMYPHRTGQQHPSGVTPLVSPLSPLTPNTPHPPLLCRPKGSCLRETAGWDGTRCLSMGEKQTLYMQQHNLLSAYSHLYTRKRRKRWSDGDGSNLCSVRLAAEFIVES